MDRFEIDQLLFNLDRIKGYARAENQCEDNEQLAADCENLSNSVQLISRAANEYIVFDALPENGFFMFLDIMAVYTGDMVKQIENQKQIKPDPIVMFRLFLLYKDFLLDLYEDLKCERNSKKSDLPNEPSGLSLMQRARCFRSIHVYRVLK